MLALLKLAWRSVWRSRRRTIITVSSIGMGLSFAIFFISFADGIYLQMVDDAVRMQAGHITIEHPSYRDAPSVDLVISELGGLRERIEAMVQVERTKAMVLGQGVARSGTGAVGVAVLGVEPGAEVASSPLATHVVRGRYLEEGDLRKVLVGKGLAERLKLDVGKKLVLSSADVHGDMVEELLRVKGVFEVGAEEVDGFIVQIPIVFARKLYGMAPGDAIQLGIVVKDPDRRGAVLAHARGLVDASRAVVLPWEQVMPELAAYIHIDRGSNLVFQGIILFLIGFTIFNTLLMSVLERKHEFAIMLALGTPVHRVKLQVLLEAVIIGLVGCISGVVVGGLLSYLVQVCGLDLRMFLDEGVAVSGFAMDLDMHAKVTPGVLAWLSGLVLLATVLLSLYTMGHASRISVADVLR